jgi:AraC-like DNA-binding protein
LATDRPYLDPGLTLVRLARRLHLPEKRLSAAVNRATGGNVSRHINGWRVRHACDLLDQGRSVTEAMLSSGFNTKSNFNREFSRVTAMTPSAWGTRSRGGAA